MVQIEGTPVVERVAVGPALVYEPFSCDVSLRRHGDESADELVATFRDAREAALDELAALEGRLAARAASRDAAPATGEAEPAAFVEVQREILSDEEIAALVEGGIREGGLHPVSAIAQTFDQIAKLFAASGSDVVAQRVPDLRDAESRILRCWHKVPERDLGHLPGPCIVVAEELYPSDTLALDRENVLGIATDRGGTASHTAIIARQLQIPAVVGAAGVVRAVRDGAQVVVDGVSGTVAVDPDDEALDVFLRRRDEAERRRAAARTYLLRPAVTTDGVPVSVKSNVSDLGEGRGAIAPAVDGAGLLRTEFLFLDRRELPGEDEQFEAYRHALDLFEGKPVVLRTADFGADKCPAALQLDDEENPSLGLRGIRLSLALPDVFAVQVRAALRASAHGPLKIMFPMVTTLDEFREAKRFVLEQGAELDRRGVAWNREVPIGAMVETPAIALLPEALAREADFASVGTNDLVQYVCAADRMNGAVAGCYQQLHPAVLRLVAGLAQAFAAQGKELSICGEIAGNWRASALLVGLGVRALSASDSSIAQVKEAICSVSAQRCAKLAACALEAQTQRGVLELLDGFAADVAAAGK